MLDPNILSKLLTDVDARGEILIIETFYNAKYNMLFIHIDVLDGSSSSVTDYLNDLVLSTLDMFEVCFNGQVVPHHYVWAIWHYK